MAFAKLNSMKFVGLDGLSHFWSKAKTWIINRITTEVTAKIAEIVANAPEDLDTLKEIADWISSHANDAAAMNTAISTNTSDIATLKTTVAGKSDTGHTHTKSEITDFPTSLPANGGTADNAKRLKTFASWGNPYLYDPTNGTRFLVFKITMPSYFNSILIQIYGDINYALSRKYILGLWHNNADGWGYNVSVTDLGGTISNALRVWLGNDGNVYLQTRCEWESRISFSYLEDITNITVEKIGSSRLGSNTDLDGNVLFTPLTDPIIDCGAIRGASDLSSASKVKQYLKADEFIGTATDATNATNDSNGNNIANTYMPKSGGTFSGSVEFEHPTYFNDEIHGNYLFPKDSIDSMFSFYKDTDNNYLPIIYGYNCGDVFNNDMCLRYYKCNYSKTTALKNLNQLKKLFASMYPYETDGCARCTSIHVTINVSFTDGKPDIIGDIINYGYCNSDGIARVNKDGSVYVGEDFYSNYHVLYISYDDGFKEKDAYYLANEILKNNMSNINYFSFIGNYVLAEHL